MGRFGGPTSKQHKLWSSSRALLESIVEGATKMPRELRLKLPGGPLVRKYIDKSGKRRFAGIPKKLRASQSLGSVCVSHSDTIKIYALLYAL